MTHALCYTCLDNGIETTTNLTLCNDELYRCTSHRPRMQAVYPLFKIMLDHLDLWCYDFFQSSVLYHQNVSDDERIAYLAFHETMVKYYTQEIKK